jgi:hypothetical protein
MPKGKSSKLGPELVAKALQQTNDLKITLTAIADTTFRNTNGLKALNKNGRPLAKTARNAAVTYPEVLPGRFDVEDFDNKLDFDEQTEPLMSLINDTVDTFVKIRYGNSADIEYGKRQIYAALTAGASDDTQYEFYQQQLAAEYEGQGKRSDSGDQNASDSGDQSSKKGKKGSKKGDKGSDTLPKVE